MVTIAEQPRQPVGWVAEIRTVKVYGRSLDIEIKEKPRGDGIKLSVKIAGLTLTRRQKRVLEGALAAWKWGVREVPPSL